MYDFLYKNYKVLKPPPFKKKKKAHFGVVPFITVNAKCINYWFLLLNCWVGFHEILLVFMWFYGIGRSEITEIHTVFIFLFFKIFFLYFEKNITKYYKDRSSSPSLESSYFLNNYIIDRFFIVFLWASQ